MSERASDNHERPEEQLAIRRLRNEFSMKGDSYRDMFFILRDYIEGDLGVPTDASVRELLRLEATGVLPTDELYDVDPEAALEKHRLAVYTTWMPLYQLNHTSDEFEAWIPYALQIVLPADGRHDDETCSSYGYREQVRDESCYISLQCPVKHVSYEVSCGLSTFDTDTPDYFFDPEKACRNAQLLISAAAKHGIITEIQKASVRSAYLRRYDKEFPKPDLSQ